MKYWLIPSNNKRFHLDKYLAEHDVIDWKQGHFKYEVGDFVFIYSSLPDANIKYLLTIEQINIDYDNSIDDYDYWGDQADFDEVRKENRFFRMKLIGRLNNSLLNIDSLLQHGLKKAPQSAQILSEPLLSFLIEVFDSHADTNEAYPENTLYEGAKTSVTVNKYERSPIARERCIQLKGTTCTICGINFEEKYGAVGKGFIHIHHIVPISSIGKNYHIDYEKDLIPVCPNCHAMLHRKINGKTLSIEELKDILKGKEQH